MANPIETLLRSWAEIELDAINLQINTLEKWLYRSYEPDKFGDGDFQQRLIKWLDNVPADAHKKLLFRLLPNLFYVGPVEFEELYRCAYQGPISRWLIESEGIDICMPDAQQKLTTAANKTWFCPLTDSLRINSFFHINNISSVASHRPDWRSMYEWGDIGKIKTYCAIRGITRLVLLEDFVGGGSQSFDSIRFAASEDLALEVLFVPLIICPSGATNARSLAFELCTKRKNALNYSAVMELPESAFFTSTGSPFKDDTSYADELRSLINSTYDQVSGGVKAGKGKPYDPFGYPPSEPTGGMVVMFSNTPDNTLPIVHWRPKNCAWNPIFPRHSRD